MSKSNQDFTSFAAQFPSERGMTRQNVRLALTGVLSLIFVCLFQFASPKTLYAQPPEYELESSWPSIITTNMLLDNRSVWINGDVRLEYSGGVGGNTTRLGNWWISGNLLNAGSNGIRYLNNLTIEGNLDNDSGNLGNLSRIFGVSHIEVWGNLTNDGEIVDVTSTTQEMPSTIFVGGDLTNTGTISNYSFISTSGLLTNRGTISGVASILVLSNGEGVPPGTGIIIVDESNVNRDAEGNFRNAGTLADVRSVVVSGSVFLEKDSRLEDVGTISAGRNIVVDGVIGGTFGVTVNDTIINIAPIDGGFRILDAAGTLTVRGHLTIDQGSVVSANAVSNFGTSNSVNGVHNEMNGVIRYDYGLVNYGLLNSVTTITNTGSMFNAGTISSSSFVNQGTIVGSGMVSVGKNGFFQNTGGIIVGGLTVNGNFRNDHGGTLQLKMSGAGIDVIRVANGKATILGGTVDTSDFFGVAGNQYLFLATDSRGSLSVNHENNALRVIGSHQPGSVMNFAPKFGYWDGTKYVSGRIFGTNNQYYWLEMQRAYSYAPYARTPNQIAMGSYLDTIGSAPKPNSAFRSLLQQLDGISDGYLHGDRDGDGIYSDAEIKADRAERIKLGLGFHMDYVQHHGQINPAALRALDELSGMIYANLGAASVHNTGTINRTLADTLRSDVFKFSMIGNPNNAIRGQAIAPLRYTRWGTVFGIGGSSKHDGNADGYTTSFGGVMAGIDRAAWTGTRVGAYFAAAVGDVSMRQLDERSDNTSVLFGMYLRQEMYYGYGFVSAGFGTDWYETKRNLTMLGYSAEGKTHATIGTVYVERGIDIPVYYATIQPYTSFQVVSVNQDKFTETMRDQTGRYTDIGLEGVEGKTHSLKLALGARAASQPIPMRWGQLALTGNMAWFHDFQGKGDRMFVAKLSNPSGNNFGTQFSDTTFRIYGNDPKQDWFNLGLGLNMDRNSTRVFLSGDLFTNSRQTLCSGGIGYITSW